MAKMFYTLAETAEQLGVSEERVRELAGEGKLQQFRDRDKLMFKRDQVESMAASGESGGPPKSPGDSGPIELSETDQDMEQIDLAQEPQESEDSSEDSRMRTGISVFDADEIEMADPLAQTVVTKDEGEDELALEGVGSGSGLLDLTRESDDTSLGAELLDEIYPGSGEGSDIALDAPSGSGAFDSPIDIEPSGTGLDHLGSTGAPAAAQQQPVEQVVVVEPDPWDPAGSGLSVGFMLVALAAVVIMGIIAVASVLGVPIELTDTFTREPNTLWYLVGGLSLAALIFGLAGFFFGAAKAKNA